MTQELLAQAQEKLSIYMQALSDTQYSAMPSPTLSLNQRGTIAGAAILQKHHIRLQPTLFEQNKTYFLEQVLPHELAHLIAHRFYGKVSPHGREWQHIMEGVFKRPAIRTHQLDISRLGLKRFSYACSCGEVALSIRRHNKVVNKQQSYICRTCKQTLVFVAEK